MKKWLSYLLFSACFFLGSAQLFPNLGGQRAGISALTFLKIEVNPRTASMGGASVSISGDAYAAQWNPAALTDLKGLTFASSNTFWTAGINHAFFSVSKNFKPGTFALSVVSLTTGKMERRTEFQPEGTGQYFYASNTAVGLTYAKQLTDMFSFGVTAKYVNEQLAEYMAHAGMLDLGFLYRTDFKDLKFAVMLQSFGTNSKLKGNSDASAFNPKPLTLSSYPAPTVFQLGVSIVPWKTNDKSLTVSVQLNHPGDNAENIRIGTEFEYKKILFIRAGYKINVKDQPYPVAGVGLRARIGRHPLNIDYSFDPTRYLGMIHRIGLSLNILKGEKK